jgi:hypothetical protein
MAVGTPDVKRLTIEFESLRCKTKVRIPIRSLVASVILPLLKSSASMVYKFGEDGDHNSGWSTSNENLN